MGHIKKSEVEGRPNSAASEGDNSLISKMMHQSTDKRHEWHEEHIARLIEETKRTFWYRLINLCLFVQDYDPYAIFKGHDESETQTTDTHQQGKANRQTVLAISAADSDQHHDSSLFAAKELRMQRTSQDDFRSKSTLFLRVLSVYHTIKMTIISIALYYVLKYEESQESKSQSISRPPILSKTILQVLGNPYSALRDIALVLYAGPPGFCTLCTVVLRNYYKRHPMNVASLRFILEPRHELKRIDASICRQVTSIKSSLQVYKSSQEQRQQQQKYRDLGWMPVYGMRDFSRYDYLGGAESRPSEFEARERKYCDKIELYLNEFCADFDELKSFRPITFAPAYYVSTIEQACKSVWGAFVMYATCGAVLSSSLVFSAYSSKCNSSSALSNCNPLQAFTLAEALILVESLLILWTTSLSSTLNLSLFSLLTRNQLDLIESTKKELRVCTKSMQKYNNSESHERQVVITINEADEQRRAGTRKDEDETSCAMRSPRDRLERSMLKSLIRLIVCSKEMRDNSRCISEQVIHPFYYVGGGLLLAFVNSQLKKSDFNFLRWFMIFIIWASFNSSAISCANIYARVLELERSSWSVLAESSKLFKDNYYEDRAEFLPAEHVTFDDNSPPAAAAARRFSQKRRTTRIMSRRASGKYGTFVGELWHKFVYATSSNLKQHCSRIFNTELNYQTIIEANFFTIFIYSLTLSHDR